MITFTSAVKTKLLLHEFLPNLEPWQSKHRREDIPPTTRTKQLVMYYVRFVRFERIRWRPYSLFALSAPFVFVIARIDETNQQNDLSFIAKESRPSFNGDGSQHAVIT
eukprot:scaffold4049_cov63-Cyclotella_meneghiniana.AAC.4